MSYICALIGQGQELWSTVWSDYYSPNVTKGVTSLRKRTIANCSIHTITLYIYIVIVIWLLNPLVISPLNSQSVKQAVQGSRGPPVAEIEFALWSKEL